LAKVEIGIDHLTFKINVLDPYILFISDSCIYFGNEIESYLEFVIMCLTITVCEVAAAQN